MADPRVAAATVDYALGSQLVTAAMAGRAVVDTASEDELRAALHTAALWLTAMAEHYGRRTGRAAGFITRARAEAVHVIETGGHCDCDACRRIRKAALDCACPNCAARKKGH